MTEIKNGQYEVILRKKWKADNDTLVPTRIRELKGKKDPTETYCTLLLNVEFRSDITENDELIGKRIELERPFIKTIDNTDGTTKKKDIVFLKKYYESVGAESNFLWVEVAEHSINKPVLITLEVKSEEYNGTRRIKYIIKDINKTKVPTVQPSALYDITDNKEDITLLDIYDI